MDPETHGHAVDIRTAPSITAGIKIHYIEDDLLVKIFSFPQKGEKRKRKTNNTPEISSKMTVFILKCNDFEMKYWFGNEND